MKPVIISYVPVVHQGYLKFFKSHPEAETIYVLNDQLIQDSDYLHKEIRQLTPTTAVTLLQSLQLPQQVALLDQNMLEQLAKSKNSIIIPREDVIEDLVQHHLPDNPITIDSIFLRWDRKNTTKQFAIDPDVTFSSLELDQKFMTQAKKQANNTSDWWRQVGAVLAKDEKIVLAGYNKHMPSEHQPYLDGDPRNAFSKGVNIELSTAIHAEAGLIAQAAKLGIGLEDTSMYVTTFPCPACAKLIAQAGIKNLYFAEGYGILDGKRVLKDAGTKIVLVKHD